VRRSPILEAHHSIGYSNPKDRGGEGEMARARVLATLSAFMIAALVMSAGPSGGVAPANAQSSNSAAADPVLVAQAAVDRARASLKCRYAFTLVEQGQNETIWATYDLRQRQTLEFDPRRPPGQRWRILATTRTDRIYQRRVLNVGGRSDPKTDLLSLTLEGDIVIRDLALQSETLTSWVFSFQPSASNTVNITAHPFLNAMSGELHVSKATGQVTRRRIYLKEPFDAGVGRVRAGDFVRDYALGDNGVPLVRATNQLLSTTVYGRGIDSTGVQSVRNVTPICDPAEVARIAAMEAEAPNVERSDVKPPTGTRLWR
jgi:hypothetical protein